MSHEEHAHNSTHDLVMPPRTTLSGSVGQEAPLPAELQSEFTDSATIAAVSRILTHGLRTSRFATMLPVGGVWDSVGQAAVIWTSDDGQERELQVRYLRTSSSEPGGEIEFEVPHQLLLIGQYSGDWSLPRFPGCSRSFSLLPTLATPSERSSAVPETQLRVAVALGDPARGSRLPSSQLSCHGTQLSVSVSLPDQEPRTPIPAVLHFEYTSRATGNAVRCRHLVHLQMQQAGIWYGEFDLNTLRAVDSAEDLAAVRVQLCPLTESDLQLLPAEARCPGQGALSFALQHLKFPTSTYVKSNASLAGIRHRAKYRQPADNLILQVAHSDSQETTSRSSGSFRKQPVAAGTPLISHAEPLQQRIEQAVQLANEGRLFDAIHKIPEWLPQLQKLLTRTLSVHGGQPFLEDLLQETLLKMRNSFVSRQTEGASFQHLREIESYACTTAKHAVFRQFRSVKARRTENFSQLPDGLAETFGASAPFQDDVLDLSPQHELWRKLTDRHRGLLELHVAGASSRQIMLLEHLPQDQQPVAHQFLLFNAAELRRAPGEQDTDLHRYFRRIEDDRAVQARVEEIDREYGRARDYLRLLGALDLLQVVFAERFSEVVVDREVQLLEWLVLQPPQSGRPSKAITDLRKRLAPAAALWHLHVRQSFAAGDLTDACRLYYDCQSDAVAVPGVTVLQRRLHAELLLNSPEVWQQLLAPAVPEYSGSSARTDAATLLEMHVLEGEPLETAWDQLQQKNKRPLAVLLPLLTAVWEQTETVVRPEHRGAFRLVD